MIRVRRSPLLGRAVMPPASENPGDSPIELTAPVAFRRRGVEMRLVLPRVALQNDHSRCDPTLIKARARARVVRGACRRTRPIAARIGRARRHHSSLCPAPRRPRLSEPRAGRGDPARPATRRAHCDAPYRTRSAARLDRSAQPPGELKSDPQQRVPRPRPGLFSLLLFDFPRGDCSNAGQRKAAKASRLGASTSRSLVSSRLTLPAKAGSLRR